MTRLNACDFRDPGRNSREEEREDKFTCRPGVQRGREPAFLSEYSTTTRRQVVRAMPPQNGKIMRRPLREKFIVTARFARDRGERREDNPMALKPLARTA
jgi:hypothetical protein